MKKVIFLGIFYCFTANAELYSKSVYGVEKIGNPYKIGRKTYTPKEYTHLQEEGYISWYGPGFHTKETANGAIFNKNTYTAAHKTLQMPAIIEITNLDNGKKVIAVVNDRGPFSESQNRILDASEKVAKELGFLNAGITRARIHFLPKETKAFLQGKPVKLGPVYSNERRIIEEPQRLKEEIREEVGEAREGEFRTNFDLGYTKGIYIQVGAFSEKSNAINVLNKLKAYEIYNVKIKSEESKDGIILNIVRVGPLEEGTEENILTKIKNLGYYNSRILILK